MNELRKLCFASVVSELHSSDIYLIFKARLFEATVPNLNGVSVTEAFIDEIVENQDKYVSTPLMADIKNLISGNYEKLGHMYDPVNDEFYSTQIGAFYKFEKECLGNHTYLVGYGKVLKRNKAVCRAMSELFASGNLKFSFEVACSSYSEREDGVMQIDADKDNYLEAMSIVFNPAYEGAVALELVAECTQIFNGEEKGDEQMNTEMLTEEVTVCPVCGEPHSPHCDEVEEKPDEEKQAAVQETEDEEVVECPEETEEPVEDKEVDAACKKKRAEEDISEESAEEVETAAEEEISEEQSSEEISETETSEDVEPAKDLEAMEDCIEIDFATKEDVAALNDAIAKLYAHVDELFAALKSASVISSVKKTVKKSNPFLSEINTPKKYTLLDSDSKTEKYSILDEE